jgi:hypothetical protein
MKHAIGAHPHCERVWKWEPKSEELAEIFRTHLLVSS